MSKFVVYELYVVIPPIVVDEFIGWFVEDVYALLDERYSWVELEAIGGRCVGMTNAGVWKTVFTMELIVV